LRFALAGIATAASIEPVGLAAATRSARVVAGAGAGAATGRAAGAAGLG
jgi:hypothetical protein